MEKISLLLLFVVFYLVGNSQINFEKGYVIDNSGKKIECLIKNKDWRSNPRYFFYKIIEDSEPIKADINTVSEFQVLGSDKYVRAKVDIDVSVNINGDPSDSKYPNFEQEEHFLKSNIEGKASLYSLTQGNLVSFFLK